MATAITPVDTGTVDYALIPALRLGLHGALEAAQYTRRPVDSPAESMPNTPDPIPWGLIGAYLQDPLVQSAVRTTALDPLRSGDWIRVREIGWAAYLDEDEQVGMKAHLTATLLSALATGNWAPYHDAWAAWKATADVLSDPSLAADLLSTWDRAEEVPLQRP